MMRALVQGNEAWLQFQAKGGDLQSLWAQGRVVEPQLQALDQQRRIVIDQLTIQRVLPQQGQGTVVGQLHPSLIVQHKNASTHALQDQRVEGFEADHFAGALLGKVFAVFQAPDQPLHQQRSGKAQCAQRAGLQVVVGADGMTETEQETQTDDAEGPDCCNQQADPAPQ